MTLPNLAAPAGPARDVAETLLSVDGVTKRWGARLVLDEVSLSLAPGSMVHVRGRNGAGKTTLLRIVAGILVPEAGCVTVDGTLTAQRQRRRYQQSLGFLPAGDRGLYARLTVRQNLDYWAAVAFIERRRRRSAIDEVVARLALHDLIEQRVDRMSTGQRQRVRLAMAFLHAPSLLLLDEPTSSLDEEGVEALSHALEAHRAAGGSTLCCSPGPDRELLPFDTGLALRDGHLEPE